MNVKRITENFLGETVGEQLGILHGLLKGGVIEQNAITVRVSQDENLLSVCAYDEQKALEEAKKKSAKQAAQADKPVLDAQGHDIRDINVIVEEVIEGKYANGDERVKLLGDRYNAVQDAVNQKCIVEKDARCAFN